MAFWAIIPLDKIRELINAIGTGNESWSSNDQYAAAYLAVAFLMPRLKMQGSLTQQQQVEFTKDDGVKHLMHG